MRNIGKIFVGVVVIGALAMSWYLGAGSPSGGERLATFIDGRLIELNWGQVAGVVLFGLVALVAEANAVDFKIGIGPRQPQASIAFLPFLAGITIWTPAVAAALVGVVVAFSQIAIRRSDWVRGPFNVAQSVISAGLSAIVYRVLLATQPPAPTELFEVLAFLPVVVTFFGTNLMLNSAAISFLRGLPVIDVLKKVAGPRGSNLAYDLIVSPLALFSAMLYEVANAYGLVLTVIPLLIVRSTYKAKQEVVEAADDLLTVLVKAIETRDPYTSGHSVRVRALAQSIAVDMQLPAAKIQLIAKAALLHDIGKIDADYAAVIRKPHDLTPDERVLIQTHAVRGAEILSGLSSVPREIVLGVRHHHERFDGNGYPDGLSGTAIPLAGRIIMICDSVDAMLSDRPYRKALPLEAVRQELLRCAGTQFDPRIVEVMLAKGTLERAADSANRVEEPIRLFAVS